MLKSGTSSEPQVLFISYENEGPVRRLRQNGRSVCVPIFPPDLRWALSLYHQHLVHSTLTTLNE